MSFLGLYKRNAPSIKARLDDATDESDDDTGDGTSDGGGVVVDPRGLEDDVGGTPDVSPREDEDDSLP